MALTLTPTPCAEVVESSLTGFVAHCWSWNTPPRFASVVLVKLEPHDNVDTWGVGIVTEVTTGSLESHRSPFPYKKDLATLKREHPHIFEFFKTTCTVALVGIFSHGKYRTVSPERPPSLHAFVCEIDRTSELTFIESPAHLPLLRDRVEAGRMDEIIIAHLSALSAEKKLTHDIIARYCNMMSLVAGSDYRRVKLLLQRLRFALPEALAELVINGQR